MNILQEKCFTKEWLAEQKAMMQRVDPGLLEKSIHALELVGLLAHRQIPFSFKGGTCMLLLLENIRRLSIDVDIACTVSGAELESILREIGKESRFETFEPDHRDPNRLPKRSHYKFTYTSAINGKANDILLDVMEEDCLYPETISKQVATPFAIPENHHEVEIPTIECLAADKLTAFAPSTIGVKYSSYGSSMKILKHCADIGALFDHCENMEKLHAAYEAIWPVENSYRNNAFSRERILDDTIDAARLIGMLDLRGCPSSDKTETLRTGIKQLDSHIIGTHFSLSEAKVCAAKAAWFATCLKQGTSSVALPRYNMEELQELANKPLQGDLVPLNRLRSGAPEAYYYWLRTASIR
ncbi:MAG: nucleotidyl transferase AbiEii/AbiGii toxin family protein [Pontiellaceae bacterium]|nr:nucleotidyl transferase AbiEii/AbiGii toxin family protein [Pontiellaceae bacterium]